MMNTGWDIIWRVTDPQWELFWPLVGVILLGAVAGWLWQHRA
jgi:hypothetical protein